MSEEAQRPITRDDLRELTDNLANALKEHEAKTQEFVRNLQTQLRNEIRADTQEFVRDAQSEILRGFHAFDKQ